MAHHVAVFFLQLPEDLVDIVCPGRTVVSIGDNKPCHRVGVGGVEINYDKKYAFLGNTNSAHGMRLARASPIDNQEINGP